MFALNPKTMKLSRVKLVVTDMDGTLLNSRGDLDVRFFGLVRDLKSHGLKIAVASGRQYYSLVNKLQEVEEELIFIAENGSIVMEGEKQLHIQPMSKELAMEIVRCLKKIGGKYIIVCGRKSAYIEQTDPRFMKPFLMHYDKYEVVDDLLAVEGDDFLKVTVCDLEGAEENTLPHVEHLKGDLQVKLSGDIWVDFTHILAQKGNALLKLQDIYDIPPEETISFGDYLNDLELFDHSYFSYAMANAHEEVIEKATFKAKSNDEGGVLLVLEELVEGLKST